MKFRSTMASSLLSLAAIAGSLVAQQPASAAGSLGYQQVSVATFAAGTHDAGASDAYADISCAKEQRCTAVGSGLDANGNLNAFADTMVDGTWAPATFIGLPQSAASIDQYSVLTGVSCPTASTCVAVGQFLDDAGNFQAMGVSMTAGSWGRAVALTSSDAPEASLLDVSCAAAGSCAAVGYQIAADESQAALEVSMAGGSWGTAQEPDYAMGTHDSTGSDELDAVACPSVSSCSAVGSFTNDVGDQRPMVQSLSSGSWSQVQEVTLPNGVEDPVAPSASLTAIACSDASSCVATGAFQDATGGAQAFAADMAAGSWGDGQVISFPEDATASGADRNDLISAVACSASSCSAVGSFATPGGGLEAMTIDFSAGEWSTAAPAAFADGLESSPPNSSFSGVSCPADGSCLAAGSFDNEMGDTIAMTSERSNGSWNAPVAASFAPGVESSSPSEYFTAVACGGPSGCVAAGDFADANDDQRAMSQSIQLVTPPERPDAPTLAAADSSIVVTWVAPLDDGGSPITGYKAVANPGGISCRSTSLSCTITGLTNGTEYSVKVKALNALGASKGSPAASATPRARPGKPTDLTATAGSARVKLRWSAPEADGGSAITSYRVQQNSGSGWVTVVDSTGSTRCKQLITGLVDGTSYRFRVAAINEAGASGWSQAASATPRS